MKDLDLRRISVYVDKRVHHIYENLVSRSSKKAEDHPFETMKDLFLVAACVGAKHNVYKELGARQDIFVADIFSAKTEVPILAALAFHRVKDLEVLSDPKKVIEIAQCWANGGIYIVRDEVLGRPGRPLYNLVDFVIHEEDFAHS